MTYIIGARCTDGVVLIADRKILRGTIPSYKKKLVEVLPRVIMGGAGNVGIIDRLSQNIKQMVFEKSIQTHHELLVYLEKESLELYNNYPHVGNFEILIGFQTGNMAQLHNILPYLKFAEPVKGYTTIGNGTQYGSLLLQKFWDDDMSMKNFAKIATLSINYVIESNLDDAVGGDTNVWFIPDIPVSPDDQSYVDPKYVPRKATDEELKEMKAYSDEKLTRLNEFLDDLIKKNDIKFHLPENTNM